jgi:2-polyprenyl-3-methyl-5-hydroxy-6-metoxy-1,4-benzoquinol methylase/glycosyltransferase involved in cell wall biosynthesis
MKLTATWNEKFDSSKLVSLKEATSSTASSFGEPQVWLEDLAIFMGYNFDPTHPSVRLCRLQLRKPLRDLGVKADIIYRYEDLEPYKNILLSHFNEDLALRCEKWRKQGKKIYFSHTEALWGLPSQVKVFNLCDYIVCCSNKLAELTEANLTSKFTKCHYLPDMAECATTEDSKLHTPQNTQPLKVVYVGMGGNSYLAHDMRPMIESLGMSLTVISEWDNADIKWDRDTYLDIMSQYDIALCPQRVLEQPAKSSVKVTTAMSRGLPVICSSNPAYVELIQPGINGFLADTPEQWKEALIKLKDFNLRQSMSQQALRTAENFTPHAIAFYWLSLLCQPRTSIALVNNTLPKKYMSYGDFILEDLRFNAYDVEEFRYEDIDRLPKGFDAYIFVEERYNPEDIADVHPRVLLTKEQVNLNTVAQFDLIVTESEPLASVYRNRGFVNTFSQPVFDIEQILEWTKIDLVDERKKHNKNLHSAHIDAFHHLQQPEDRWVSGQRDIEHIKYTIGHTAPNQEVLDIGSADGWLSLYLAKEGRKVSALDFVRRGMDWTLQHATRLGVELDLRYGFLEEVEDVFQDKKFDCILAYEILEHVDYLRLPWYLEKIESLLKDNGKVLISLPKQDLNDNPEHLFSPSEKLINKVFHKKANYKLQWASFLNYGVEGGWFISYHKD